MDTRGESEIDGPEEFDQRELLAYFLETLSAGLDPRELRKRGEKAQRALVIHALPLFESLQPGEIKVRVSNPGGHRTGRTVLELLVADQPFLVDTFQVTIHRLGLRGIFLMHPLLAIERDADGRIAQVGKSAVDSKREAYLYAEIPLVKDAARSAEIEAELRHVFSQLRDAVADHRRMVEALQKHMAGIELCAPLIGGGTERAHKLMSFLQWLSEDNYVFLGYRYDRVGCEGGVWQVELDRTSALGLLRDTERALFRKALSGEQVPAPVRSRLESDRLVFFDKSRSESTIHRKGRLDCVSIKVLDQDGRVEGFGRFIGLLTHNAIRGRGSAIPILSKRLERVLEAVGAQPSSHTYKAAVEAFDSLPVEFLFPFDLDDVIRAVQRIIRAAENPQVDVYVVPDPLNRSFFVSVILPRPLYDEELRGDLRELLTDRYGASYIDNRTSFLDDEIALIHFFCTSSEDVRIDTLAELERDIKDRATGWETRFEAALLERHATEQAYQLAEEYGSAFPEEYRVVTKASDAVRDVENLERLRQGESRVELDLRTRVEEHAGGTRWIKIYQKERPYLTDLLPVLDNFGLQVIDATLTQMRCGSDDPLWIVTFRMEPLPADGASSDDVESLLLDGLRSVLWGRAENDPLNCLILRASVGWPEVRLVRAYLTYARQLGGASGRRLAAEALLKYPAATRALLDLFRARFDPDLSIDRGSAEKTALAGLAQERECIRTAADDRVFGLLANLVLSTTRTNFFAAPPEALEPVAFKIDPKCVKAMPSPRPYAEIFVHCAEMNGVHLRGGLIARGGIRWADHIQGLRSEILGLMKTQMTKNGLIVPAGAKGGFVLKRRFPDAASARKEADRQYARFMRTLLGITDNIVGDRVVPPERVFRHDGDDPYLVVAADKGTAHLSDAANRVAEGVGYWLGDAFASGGSDGYDHKREGITARGAWLCVKRHFLELGMDIESQPFTMVGIGDMSGDVFGNGMLLARKARLLAAFNHLHIFLDPDPNSELVRHELKRLFELPGSSWSDFAPEKISEGGGVFDRAARAVPLAPRVRAMLGVEEEVLSGEELIRAILRMPVDLLWNGGIGTYVKASRESDADVGDRVNAAVRIDASKLRVRVVGEGGNLGLTQLARIEYALAGGRLNTDAIDNSGGVDLSDHEVNFKILLAPRCKAGRMSRDERNAKLRACLREADAAVLAHCAAQSRCISMDLLRSREDPERMILVTEFLAQHADLDPALEFLPEKEELHARASLPGAPIGSTRPELAILLGYTKLLAKRELVSSDVPDHPSLRHLLRDYLPESLREILAGGIDTHPLRREITATCLTNRVIDQAGVTLVPELERATGASVAEVLLACYTADRSLEAGRLRSTLEAQPVSEAVRLGAALRIEDAVREAAYSCLPPQRSGWSDAEEFAKWTEQVRALRVLIDEGLMKASEAGVEPPAEALAEGILEPGLAREIDRLPGFARALGAVSLALRWNAPLARVVQLHASVGEATRISWLLQRLHDMDRDDDWGRLACDALHVEMLEAQRSLTGQLLAEPHGTDALSEFSAAHARGLEQIERTVQQIEAGERCGLAPLTVLSQQIRRLC